jgi:hypothetical protein
MIVEKQALRCHVRHSELENNRVVYGGGSAEASRCGSAGAIRIKWCAIRAFAGALGGAAKATAPIEEVAASLDRSG